MCARRPFEISAAATPMVSNASRALDELLPGLIFQADDAKSMSAILGELLGDKKKRLWAGHKAWRFVMEHHTYANRTKTICEELGLQYESNTLEWPFVTLCIFNGHSITDQNYEGKCEYLIVDFESKNIRQIASECRGELMVFFDGSLNYSADVLKDIVLAFRYARADIIGKIASNSFKERLDLSWRYIQAGVMSVFSARREDFSQMPIEVTNGGMIVQSVEPTRKVYTCDPVGIS